MTEADVYGSHNYTPPKQTNCSTCNHRISSQDCYVTSALDTALSKYPPAEAREIINTTEATYTPHCYRIQDLTQKAREANLKRQG